jgi:hypothetical protein
MYEEASMEGDQNTSNSSKNPRESGQAIALIAQFMQSTVSMQHIDEVFLWLSKAMAQQLGIPVVEFWANQCYTTSRPQIELRAAACLNPAMLRQVFINEHVQRITERFLRERQQSVLLPVERIFPPLQVSFLTKYELHYWTAYTVEHQAFLPPARFAFVPEKIATPLNMIVSGFTQTPLTPGLQRAVSFVTEQSLRIIVNRGFLSTEMPAAPAPPSNTDQNVALSLNTLIPRRTQHIEDLQAANPFAHASIIADKNARRLYGLVDDKKRR